MLQCYQLSGVSGMGLPRSSFVTTWPFECWASPCSPMPEQTDGQIKALRGEYI